MKPDRKELGKKAGHLASTPEDVGRRTCAETSHEAELLLDDPLKPGSLEQAQSVSTSTKVLTKPQAAGHRQCPQTCSNRDQARLTNRVTLLWWVETIFGRFGVLLPF
jgi:hypothetical protein